MSTPERSGRSRPLRVAGLVLLGVAVGALLVGLITLAERPDGDGDAAPATGATTTAGTDTATTPTTAPATTEPSPATTPAPPPATTAPPAPTAAPTTAEQAPPPEPTAPIRVYNNSTIRGLAAQAAEDFRRFGWAVVEVANYPSGIIPTSTVYYRPGTDEEAAARRLAQRFNLRVEPRFDGIAGASPGVIVIVTNDYGSK